MDNVIMHTLFKGYECERIRLRPLRFNDAGDMFEYCSDEETCRFLSWGPYLDITQAKAFIEKTLIKYNNPSDIVWGIEEKGQHKLIGVVRLYDFCSDSVTVSYILNRNYSGNGYMTEAVRAAIQVSFDALNKPTVYAYYAENNIKSLNVMKRCGMSICDNCCSTQRIKGIDLNIYRCMIRRSTI